MEDISIVNELKELAGLQTEYAKTKMAIKFREVKNNAINKVSSIKSYIDEQAKIYGENNENIVSIKEEYSNTTEELKRDGLIDNDFDLELENISFLSFAEDILKKYGERFDLSNIIDSE